MTSIRSNIDGTTAPRFQIGKGGPTIRQGSDDPSTLNLVGKDGDLYVRTGVSPRLYQLAGSVWVDTSSDLRVRRTITNASDAINDYDTYVGIRVGGDVNLTLPVGRPGLKVVIKDEVGRDDQHHIVIWAIGSDTIDGAVLHTLENHEAVTLFFGSEWHIIASHISNYLKP